MQSKHVMTALAGLLAATLVGIGEYLLHYDAPVRFTGGGYDFMKGILGMERPLPMRRAELNAE